MWFRDNLRIETRNRATGGNGFGKRFSRIGLIEQCLPLQIAELYVIAINDPQASNAGASEERSQSRSSCSTAHDSDLSAEERFLTCFANPREKNLPRISLVNVGFHRCNDLRRNDLRSNVNQRPCS